jgi:hypothetical protein
MNSRDIIVRVNYIPSKPPDEFRVYHDNIGTITMYTTKNLPGEFILVTKEQYVEARYDLLVRDGELINPKIVQYASTLVKNDSTGVQTSKYDINILTDDSEILTYWTHEHIEISDTND